MSRDGEPSNQLGFALGQIPGEPIYTGPPRGFDPHLRAVNYDPESLREIPIEDLREDLPGTTWVDVQGVHVVEDVLTVARVFHLHALTVEDIVAPGQRVKIDDHAGQLTIRAQMQHRETHQLEQLTLVVGPNYVLSFQEQLGDCFDRIRQRLRSGTGRLRRRNAAYLAYALLDALVDDYAVVQARIAERVAELEEELDEDGAPDGEFPVKIHEVRRRLGQLKRMAAPLADEIGRLLREEHQLMDTTVRPYFRDLLDHLVQVREAVEVTRETSRSLLEIHLSSVTHKMNQDMRVLTVVATIFIPLTFLAGVYGMNFRHMPELELEWAYPTFWALCVLIVVGLGVYFRRREWL